MNYVATNKMWILCTMHTIPHFITLPMKLNCKNVKLFSRELITQIILLSIYMFLSAKKG